MFELKVGRILYSWGRGCVNRIGFQKKNIEDEKEKTQAVILERHQENYPGKSLTAGQRFLPFNVSCYYLYMIFFYEDDSLPFVLK
jgi:hypothetical protein